MSDYAELDEIMDGIRAREEAAFATAYRRTAGQLASFANGLVHDRRFAEDAVQQAFFELVRAAPKIRGDGRSLRAWLFRSVRYTCRDELRRRARHPEALIDRPDAVGVEFRPTPLSLELDPDLRLAMSRLTSRQRTLLVLRHVVGMSGQETATVVGSTRAAVYAATARAERRLRRLLSEKEGMPV